MGGPGSNRIEVCEPAPVCLTAWRLLIFTKKRARDCRARLPARQVSAKARDSSAEGRIRPLADNDKNTTNPCASLRSFAVIERRAFCAEGRIRPLADNDKREQVRKPAPFSLPIQ